jgi:hypothetical protein
MQIPFEKTIETAAHRDDGEGTRPCFPLPNGGFAVSIKDQTAYLAVCEFADRGIPVDGMKASKWSRL